MTVFTDSDEPVAGAGAIKQQRLAGQWLYQCGGG
jgi:hypothetical protein